MFSSVMAATLILSRSAARCCGVTAAAACGRRRGRARGLRAMDGSVRRSAVVQYAAIASCAFWTVLVVAWVANAVRHRKARVWSCS
jgi:hypothetical protein